MDEGVGMYEVCDMILWIQSGTKKNVATSQRLLLGISRMNRKLISAFHRLLRSPA